MALKETNQHMDIKAALAKGQSKTQTQRIVKYIGEDKARFKQLMDLFLKEEYRIVQRAAWPVSEVAIQKPKLILSYLPQLLRKLDDPGLHPAVPRNILRIFQTTDIPEKYHGTLIDLCFKFITDASNAVAVRAFSITTASRICLNYPEIKNELMILLDELSGYPQTAAISVRIRDARKELLLKTKKRKEG